MNEIYHGILKHSKEIILPEEWTDLVKQDTITVCITPIGAHQDIIVKEVFKVTQSFFNRSQSMPIECYYHVVGEKIDTEEES